MDMEMRLASFADVRLGALSRGAGRRSNRSTSESVRDTGKSIYPVCTYARGHHTDKLRRCTETIWSRYAYASNDTYKFLNKPLFKSPANESDTQMDEEPSGLPKVCCLGPHRDIQMSHTQTSLPSLLVARASRRTTSVPAGLVKVVHLVQDIVWSF